MKKLLLMVILVLIAVNIAYAQFYQDGSIPDKRVGVIDDVKTTGSYTYNISDVVYQKIKTYLENFGWTIVARGEEFQSLIDEENLPGINPNTAAIKNKRWGATTNIKISVNIATSQNSRSEDNNIYILNFGNSKYITDYYAEGTLTLTAIDTETGQVLPAISVSGSTNFSEVNNNNTYTPIGNFNSGNSSGNGMEIVVANLVNGLAEKAATEMNSKYFCLPRRPVLNQFENESYDLTKLHRNAKEKKSLVTPEKLGFSSSNYNYDLIIKGQRGQEIEISVFSEKDNKYKKVKTDKPLFIGKNGIKIQKNAIGKDRKIMVSNGNQIKQGTIPCEIDFNQ